MSSSRGAQCRNVAPRGVKDPESLESTAPPMPQPRSIDSVDQSHIFLRCVIYIIREGGLWPARYPVIREHAA